MSSSLSSSTATTTAAELSTERLTLRAWTADEVADVLAGRRPTHWAQDFPADGDRVIASVIAQQIADGPQDPGAHGHRLIVERDGGTVVGSLSLLWPPSEGSVEFGYGVVPSRRGRGYAPEAVRALVAHALTSPEVTVVYAEVELGNEASVRVLEKAGLHRWSSDGTTALYRTDAPEAAPSPE
ncbi:GNAT family N-acetyltransferase [Streptomyces venezuelae]|uniref:GNAT family N-acetyltransferase n=1 Tax=Streptomyces venezuelae TaxID=54571 RepID=UPI001CC22584|nr:GNAT family N-acetyltransferase [Streptomyces venezuelae]